MSKPQKRVVFAEYISDGGKKREFIVRKLVNNVRFSIGQSVAPDEVETLCNNSAWTVEIVRWEP